MFNDYIQDLEVNRYLFATIIPTEASYPVRGRRSLSLDFDIDASERSY